MSLQSLLLSSTRAQKTWISGQPKYGQATVRCARMSHQTPTLTIIVCVQDGDGEKADRERLKK